MISLANSFMNDVPPAESDVLFAFHPGGCDRSRYICFHTTLKAHITPTDDLHTLWSCDN